ncbi:MAG: peptidyl-tRNA hydrolase [Gordonia sp. (in: high G+C Gram-positive bacteria)]|uniref:peptidyl-tRNA hydrolase n=1 Tax=Gordonia sp. (in: high G+C Gram-positive bacteria) TaxID=84139 RepID=UPI003C775140
MFVQVIDQYRRLVSYLGRYDDSEDPANVQAMQMVLRIEKNDPPGRHRLLVAAARSVALLCLDPRVADDGEWAAPMDAWCDARIRKIARRARGAQWLAAQDVAGVTAEVDGAMARAYVPGRVGEVDKRIAKLQIGGTDIDGDLPGDEPAPTAPGGLTLWVNPDLAMTVGKTAAQVGHAAMLGVRLMTEAEAADWYAAGCPLDVRRPGPDHWAQLTAAVAAGRVVGVQDAGFTEIEPGSLTVVAERR